MSIRTPLAKVRGLGSAKDGTHHWWMQRLTSVALIPLCIWLVYSLLGLGMANQATVAAWMKSPVQALLMTAFLGATIYHSKLGIQVIIEDYVHAHFSKNALLMMNAFGFIILFAMAFMAIITLHLS